MTSRTLPATSAADGTVPVVSFRGGGRFRRGFQSVEALTAMTQIDGWLLACIAGLCAFGLVMVYSASEPLGYEVYGNANYFFERQLFWLALGGAGMVVAARTDYHRWHERSRRFAVITVVMLVLVLVPHVGTELYGARRWFAAGSLSFQPSAVATLIAIVFFARWLVDRGPGVRSWKVVRDYSVVLIALLVLVILEKDLGTTMVIAGIGLVILALAGALKRHLALIVGAMATLGYLAIRVEAYRASRLNNFSNPFADPLGTGFQSVQSLFALGSGGITGVGLGNSIQKYEWLPEAHTDFIFAIIGEELGLIGTLAVLLTFIVLAWRGVAASVRAPDTYGALIAGGITAWISIQAFINIAAVTNVIPTTGIPLPFISYGGSSLVVTLVAVGILCNVSSQGMQQGASQGAHVDRRGRNRGPSHARAGGRSGAAAG
jgi:cell division protein FtsW